MKPLFSSKNCLGNNGFLMLNLGSFYRFVNKRISNRAGIGTVLENSVELTADHDKAHAFNSYFTRLP